MYNETLRLCPHQSQERLLPTDTVAPRSHSFCSPASSGRSLLSSTVNHQRDAFMRLEISVNSTQFIPIQLSRTHLLVCVKHVVFVLCCLNLFFCNCTAPKDPGSHLTGVSCEKKIANLSIAARPSPSPHLLFISFYLHHPLTDY